MPPSYNQQLFPLCATAKKEAKTVFSNKEKGAAKEDGEKGDPG